MKSAFRAESRHTRLRSRRMESSKSGSRRERPSRSAVRSAMPWRPRWSAPTCSTILLVGWVSRPVRRFSLTARPTCHRSAWWSGLERGATGCWSESGRAATNWSGSPSASRATAPRSSRWRSTPMARAFTWPFSISRASGTRNRSATRTWRPIRRSAGGGLSTPAGSAGSSSTRMATAFRSISSARSRSCGGAAFAVGSNIPFGSMATGRWFTSKRNSRPRGCCSFTFSTRTGRAVRCSLRSP